MAFGFCNFDRQIKRCCSWCWGPEYIGCQWRHRICGHDTIVILWEERVVMCGVQGRRFIVLFKQHSICYFVKMSVWSLACQQSVFHRYHSEKKIYGSFTCKMAAKASWHWNYVTVILCILRQRCMVLSNACADLISIFGACRIWIWIGAWSGVVAFHESNPSINRPGTLAWLTTVLRPSATRNFLPTEVFLCASFVRSSRNHSDRGRCGGCCWWR